MSPKLANNFHCISCDYKCSKQSDYNKHLITRKHQILTKYSGKVAENNEFQCYCGKVYKHRQSLNNHKKKCKSIEYKAPDISFQEEDPLLVELIKQNKELQDTLINQQKEYQEELNNLIPYIGDKTINNKININVFLNETCKDAINIGDFMKSLQITLDDLEITREKGLLESVNNKILCGLNSMDLEKRPIHCTDQKRKIMHIKDNDIWEKDDNNDKLKKSIDYIAEKQLSEFSVWEKANPEFMESNEGQKKYVQLLSNITKDIDEERDKNKIIQSIAKKVII
jgi:hypothetical protein